MADCPAVRPFILLSLLLLLPFSAARAAGLVLRVEPGYSYWQLDAGRIQAQAQAPGDEVRALLVDQTQNAPTLSLLLGFNLFNHFTLSAGVTATGWDLRSASRGGAGLVAGELAWHPAALLLPSRPGWGRRWDVSLFFGAGYGMLGEQRALDGLHLQFGGRGEYFLLPILSVGASLRYAPLFFGRYVRNLMAGESTALPDTSGGAVFIPALTFSLHVPLG